MAVDMFLKLDGIDGESKDAKHAKEISGDAEAFRVANFPAIRKVKSLPAPGSDFGETFLALADLFPHRERELRILAGKITGAPVTVGDTDSAKLLRIFDRNGAKAYGINQLKDGRVGADAQREG